MPDAKGTKKVATEIMFFDKDRTVTIWGLDPHYLTIDQCIGLSKLFASLAEIDESISEIGYNEETEITWLSLDNGIILTSLRGEDTLFQVINSSNGEETFHKTYQTAWDYQGEIFSAG